MKRRTSDLILMFCKRVMSCDFTVHPSTSLKNRLGFIYLGAMHIAKMECNFGKNCYFFQEQRSRYCII